MNPSKEEAQMRKQFAKRMVILRGERSLRDIAREAGTYHSAIRQMEIGERMPGAFALVRLARVFGVSVDELLGV